MSANPPTDPPGGMSSYEPGGLCFEDFEVGQIYLSARRTLTEADITNFAGLSGDFNPLHTDEVFAARTPFRGRVAHGLLVQSVASGLANQMGIFHGTIQALQGMEIKFLKPVRPGDSLQMKMTVTEIDPEPSARRGHIRLRTEVLNQHDEAVIDGCWTTVMNRRRSKPVPAPAEEASSHHSKN